MKVVAINDWMKSPLSNIGGEGIKKGGIYTVIDECNGYSEYAQRTVDAYEFYEIDGLYEKGIFIPLISDDNVIDVNVFNAIIKVCLNTKPERKISKVLRQPINKN